MLSTILMLTSKKLTDDLDFSSVNFKLIWKLLRRFRSSSSWSSPSVRMKNMSSIYLNHNHGLTISESRNSFSILSINKHAYGGANLVPIAVPEICWMILVSNSKKLFFQYVFSHFSYVSRWNFLFALSSNFSHKAWRPAPWWILGYRPTTSAVTNMGFKWNITMIFKLF